MADPIVASPEATPVQPVAKQEPDLLTKVSQFRKAESAPTPAVPEGPDIGFDYKELESIKDPIAKETAIKAYKSMQAGFTKKTQELAEKSRVVEQKLKEGWTPERIQNELLTNPQFVQAAQVVASAKNPPNSGLTDEEFSNLSDTDKRQMAALQNEVLNLKQVNMQTTIQQEDERLKSRFTDYDAVMVDNATRDMSRMQPHQIREYVYKAVNYEKNIKNAYELGKEEALRLKQEKINGISTNGYDVSQTNEVPERNKGERDTEYMARLTLNRLAQSRK